MGLIHEDKAFGLKIRESANDGSDFSIPEADYRLLFLGEDGELHVKDSAGVVTAIGAGAGGVPYLVRRLAAELPGANATLNVNSTSYVQIGNTDFYHDWDGFPATHFMITCFGGSNAGGATISMQLATIAAPGTPLSAGGDDLVLTSTVQNWSSGWIAIPSPPSGIVYMGVTMKGSNSTVDFTGRWVEIAMKID